jgi:hypothetical protein
MLFNLLNAVKESAYNPKGFVQDERDMKQENYKCGERTVERMERCFETERLRINKP